MGEAGEKKRKEKRREEKRREDNRREEGRRDDKDDDGNSNDDDEESTVAAVLTTGDDEDDGIATVHGQHTPGSGHRAGVSPPIWPPLQSESSLDSVFSGLAVFAFVVFIAFM